MFIVRIGERVNETDSDRLDAAFADNFRHFDRLGLIDLGNHFSGIVDPLRYHETIRRPI